MAKICIIAHFEAKGEYSLKMETFCQLNGIMTSSEAHNFLENLKYLVSKIHCDLKLLCQTKDLLIISKLVKFQLYLMNIT